MFLSPNHPQPTVPQHTVVNIELLGYPAHAGFKFLVTTYTTHTATSKILRFREVSGTFQPCTHPASNLLKFFPVYTIFNITQHT